MFIDQDYQALYTSEERVSVLSKYFAGIAILISCLGLFGLITFTIERRLKEHNQGKSKYTQSYRPWELIYKEVCEDYKSARAREKYLKSAAGKKFVKKKIASL